jgi:GNAT superfamily N-acetyltransferase
VFVVQKEPLTAQLRILLVDPSARGHRIGQRLIATAVEFARVAGYARLVLWTNHPLVAARQIYLTAGFRLVKEEPHHSFGVDLVGQFYELNLAQAAVRANEHGP